MRLPEIATDPGPYFWEYVDVQSGPFTAVAIFMVGSPFSADYAARHHEVPGSAHSAVNFAVYQHGQRRSWVLSEYSGCESDGRTLRIGASSFTRHEDGRVVVEIEDHEAPRGGAVSARLTLTPRCPLGEEVELIPGAGHFWRPVALRCEATVELRWRSEPVKDSPGTLSPVEGWPREADHASTSSACPVRLLHRRFSGELDGVERFSGTGYHDQNRGVVPLGVGVSGWSWERSHRRGSTEVQYRLEAGDLRALATEHEVAVTRAVLPPEPLRRTAWGLNVPRRAALLESSPFYARLSSSGDSERLCEVADFARFQSPLIRWMARQRSRVEAR